MLGGTQAALETGVVDDFPLNDQEILVRHLHKVAVDWVEEYQREHTPGGGVTDDRSPTAQRLRRTRAVRRELVSGNRTEALGQARWPAPCRRCSEFYDAFFSAAGRGDRVLRQVPPRRSARRCAQSAAPDLFTGHGRDADRDHSAPAEARRLRRRRHRPRRRTPSAHRRERTGHESAHHQQAHRRPSAPRCVGIDSDRLASDDALGEAVLEALEDNGVLVFPELDLDPEAQVAFCRRLGEIDHSSDGHHPVAGIYPITLDKSKNASAAYLQATFDWHIDGCTPIEDSFRRWPPCCPPSRSPNAVARPSSRTPMPPTTR